MLFPSDKCGRLPKGKRDMEVFHAALADCELVDLGYSSSHFTWDNERVEDDNIRQWLDQFCANVAWCEIFRFFSIYYGARELL